MYGATKTMASTTSQRKPCGPFEATSTERVEPDERADGEEHHVEAAAAT